MKYIGATDAFVRAPFVLEGIVLGVIGAAVPLIGLAAGMILTAVLICLCNLIYFKATPPQCIPAGEHFLFWRAFG